MECNKKYNYFYKITNLINGNFYYGIHSTDNVNDKYMGSGTHLREAYKLYGKENFVKEILRYFNTREEASAYEATVVTESLVIDNKCYNMKEGGDYGLTTNTVIVIDKDKKMHRCVVDDERLKTGEYTYFMKNKVYVFDKIDKSYKIVSCEDFYQERSRYETITQNHVGAYDKEGNCILVPINDERFKTGELKHIWSGKKHTEETKKKISETSKNRGSNKGCKNSHYNTVWVYKDGANKSIKKDLLEVYISDGWRKGRIVNKEDYNIKYGPEYVNIIKGLRNKGLSWKEISQKTKISKTTLTRYRKKYHIEE